MSDSALQGLSARDASRNDDSNDDRPAQEQTDDILSDDRGKDILDYGSGTSAPIPQLGFNRDQLETFQNEMKENLPKIRHVLLAP